jgi:hypothetical protein
MRLNAACAVWPSEEKILMTVVKPKHKKFHPRGHSAGYFSSVYRRQGATRFRWSLKLLSGDRYPIMQDTSGSYLDLEAGMGRARHNSCSRVLPDQMHRALTAAEE